MDFVSQIQLRQLREALPPHQFYETTHPSSTNFSLGVILVIGMMLTSFFLIGYYMLVIRCCFNWHHVDHTRIFSLSSHIEDPSATYSTASEPRGLEEAVIRLIPVIQYKPDEGDTYFVERSFSQCSVCLSEFQENEKLRVIPNCSHVFHIDCIDVWLQNNAHCPLCRRIVSLTSQVHVDQVNLIAPRPSPQGQSQNIENLIGGSDEGFVVIDLDGENDSDQNLRHEELPTVPTGSISSLVEQNKVRKLQKVTSLGDECIGIRAKDDRFSVEVQAMRRSFSMDSLMNTKSYGAVQQVLQQQNGIVHEVSTIEANGSSSRVKRSFYSFGPGSRSRSSAVLPVYLDP